VERVRSPWRAAAAPGKRNEGTEVRIVQREGGAREGRCREKASRGVGLCGMHGCQVTCCSCGKSSRTAAARTGTCTEWHTEHAVSGGPLCWCSKAPPLAKYNSAMQPSSASPRRQFQLSSFNPSLSIDTRLVYQLRRVASHLGCNFLPAAQAIPRVRRRRCVLCCLRFTQDRLPMQDASPRDLSPRVRF
jgi:hypothetical protein